MSLHPSIRKARTLAATLFDTWNDVLLYRTLATLQLDVPTFDTVDALRWTGPCRDFEDCCRRLQSRTSSPARYPVWATLAERFACDFPNYLR